MKIYLADNAWSSTIAWTGPLLKSVLFPYTHKKELKTLKRLKNENISGRRYDCDECKRKRERVK